MPKPSHKKPMPGEPNPAAPKCLRPDTMMLSKLGSVVAHTEELLGPNGNPTFDGPPIAQLLLDPEVQQWLKQMRALALIPEPRSG